MYRTTFVLPFPQEKMHIEAGKPAQTSVLLSDMSVRKSAKREAQAQENVLIGICRTLFNLGINAAFAVNVVATFLAISSNYTDFWLSEIFAHFWLQFGIGFVLIAIIQWLRHHRNYARVAVVCSLLFLPVFASTVPWREFLPETTGAVTTRIMFANVLYDNGNYDRLVSQIDSYHPDVVVLAEMPTQLDEQLITRLSSLPQHYFVQHEYAAFQLAIFSRLPFISEPQTLLIDGVGEGAVDVTVESLGGAPLRIIGIHPTPPFTEHWGKNRNVFMTGLAADIVARPQPTLVVGDFNNSPVTPTFQQFLTTSGLQDSRKGWGWQGSWPSALPEFLRISIDHAVHSKDVGISDRQLGGQNGSDHLPVIVDVWVKKR